MLTMVSMNSLIQLLQDLKDKDFSIPLSRDSIPIGWTGHKDNHVVSAASYTHSSGKTGIDSITSSEDFI